MRECSSCHNFIPDGLRHCPHCGKSPFGLPASFYVCGVFLGFFLWVCYASCPLSSSAFQPAGFGWLVAGVSALLAAVLAFAEVKKLRGVCRKPRLSCKMA